MRWPFSTKAKETDLRFFHDPKTGDPTLQMKGNAGFAGGTLKMDITLRSPLSKDAALHLRDQINAMYPGE